MTPNKRNCKNLFIFGGATINNLFMSKGLVDRIILNYNPQVLGNEIPLFKGVDFSNKSKLTDVKQEQEDIVQVLYESLNKKYNNK